MRSLTCALLGAVIAVTTVELARTSPVAASQSPATGLIQKQIRSAVRTSHAQAKTLRIDTRSKKLRLDVSVRDPAAYLRHRYARVVDVIYPGLVHRFAYIYLKVLDGNSGRAVLSYSDVPGFGAGAGRQQQWHIRWSLLDCARNLPLDDIEIDPDYASPPCPAP